MFVDDERDVLTGFQRALRREPYRVLTAATGEEALAVLEAEAGAVDVIVSDEHLGSGMPGSELLAVVRQSFPSVVRILLTGAGLGDSVRAIGDGQPYRFLSKPVSLPELGSTLRNALRMREVLTQSPSGR